MVGPDTTEAQLEVSADAYFIGTAIHELAAAIRELAQTQRLDENGEPVAQLDMAGNPIR